MLNEVVMIDKRTGRRWRIRGRGSKDHLQRVLANRMLMEHLPIAVRVELRPTPDHPQQDPRS